MFSPSKRILLSIVTTHTAAGCESFLTFLTTKESPSGDGIQFFTCDTRTCSQPIRPPIPIRHHTSPLTDYDHGTATNQNTATSRSTGTNGAPLPIGAPLQIGTPLPRVLRYLSSTATNAYTTTRRASPAISHRYNLAHRYLECFATYLARQQTRKATRRAAPIRHRYKIGTTLPKGLRDHRASLRIASHPTIIPRRIASEPPLSLRHGCTCGLVVVSPQPANRP